MPVGDVTFISVSFSLIKSIPTKKRLFCNRKGFNLLHISNSFLNPADTPKIILFTIEDVTAEAANEALRTGGMSNLVRVDRVQTLPRIPVLGSGKTDYGSLMALSE